MIDLYALTSPNVQKVFLMLEETGLPYTTIPVDVWKAEQFKPEFLKINPNAKVPAIVDHDGPDGRPYTVIESGAILIYLAEKSGRFLPAKGSERHDVLQWLMVQLTGVGPMFGQHVHFSRFAPAGSDYSKSRYATEVLRLYDLVEQRLAATGGYLGGAEYSIADIATYPWMRNFALAGVDAAAIPNVRRWVEEITARPATKRMLDILPTITSVRDHATDDHKDRFFGRGKYARA